MDNGSIMFLRARSELGSGIDAAADYWANADAAAKVVSAFAGLGVGTFLLQAASVPQIRVMGSAIHNAGLRFYTDERWTWGSALDDFGRFQPDRYVQNRVVPDLVPLKRDFPTAFAGFHFRDEPGLIEFPALGALTACLRAQPEFAGMNIFLNLFPIFVNYGGLSGLDRVHAGSRAPLDYGVNCDNGAFDKKRFDTMAAGYGLYARRAAMEVTPDQLAFDLYPFDGALLGCVAARELTVAENLSIVRLAAEQNGAEPVAYLQNFIDGEDGFQTNFHHLRWFASWAVALGVRTFANFISHTSKQVTGLLDQHNNPTSLALALKDLDSFVKPVQAALAGSHWLGFAAPFISVEPKHLINFLSVDDVLVGMYEGSANGRDYAFFARRPLDGTLTVQAGFTSSYAKIEEWDFNAGVWTLIQTGSNSVDVTLKGEGSLLQLTR